MKTYFSFAVILLAMTGVWAYGESFGPAIPAKPAVKPTTPEQAVEQPPAGSVGIRFCDNGEVKVVIWVTLQNQQVMRFDEEHHPATQEGVQKFYAWVLKAPHDYVEYKCAKQ